MVRRAVVRQNDFSFGEVSPDFAAGGDKDSVAASLKRGRNVRLLNSLGISQRPGSNWKATVGSLGRTVLLTTSLSEQLIAVIYEDSIAIYSEAGGLLQTVSPTPWDATQALEVVTETVEDGLYIAHKDILPRVLSRDDAGVWSLADYEFAAGAGGSKEQLYFRFAERGVTLTPSALTGAITVSFSAPVLEAGHVNTRFRYHGKEIEIDTVIDSQNGTATVIDDLPPSYQITLADATGFRPGEDVEGKTTQAKGLVHAIAGALVDVIVFEGYEGFEDTASSEETIVGVSTQSKIVAGSQTPIAPRSSTVWDEQVFSSVRGYPGIVFQRSGRLGFADFPQIPDGIALSSPGVFDDFNLGEGSVADAIFVRAGNPSSQRIKHVVSSNSLIILTDRKAYYVPENEDTPLAADTISFQEIAPTGASNAFPIAVEDGVIYCEQGGNRVVGLLATGELGGPWRLIDLSEFSSHLISDPVSFAKTIGNSQAPERYIYCLNGDGTVAVLKFDKKSPQRLGWVLWTTAGFYHSMIDIRGIVFSLCERTIGGLTVYLLESFDENSQLDASSRFTDQTAFQELISDSGELIVSDSGETIMTGAPTVPHLIGQTVHVIRGTAYLGEYDVIAPGVLDGLEEDPGDFEVGLHFPIDAVLWPAEPPYDTSPGFRKRKNARVAVKTERTGVFALGIEGRAGKIRPAYDPSRDNLDADPPLRSEVWRKTFSGWSHEPCVQITRPIPSPVKILSVAMEVAS